MTNKIVLFGTGDIAELASFYFEQDSPFDVVAFTVDGEFVKEDSFIGKPVVPFEELGARFPPADCRAFVALSYRDMNVVRQSKVTALREAGYGLASYISSKATVWPDLSDVENAFILEDNTIQPFVRIGHNVTLWSGNHIGHHSVIHDNVFISSHVVVSGGVVVGENCFLGVNCTIRDHVTLAPFTLVGMGVPIAGDTQAEGVYINKGKVEPARIPSTKLKRI